LLLLLLLLLLLQHNSLDLQLGQMCDLKGSHSKLLVCDCHLHGLSMKCKL